MGVQKHVETGLIAISLLVTPSFYPGCEDWPSKRYQLECRKNNSHLTISAKLNKTYSQDLYGQQLVIYSRNKNSLIWVFPVLGSIRAVTLFQS
jgi:hypothetical protein